MCHCVSLQVTVGSNIKQTLVERLAYEVTTTEPTVPVTTGVPLEIIIPFSVIIIIFVLVVFVLMIVFICFYLNSRRKSVSIARQQQNMELVGTG